MSQPVNPPYFAVIFTSRLTPQAEHDGYTETADRMLRLAREMPGFIGFESTRSDNLSISVSYWKDEQAIIQWRDHVEHQAAQAAGQDKWYEQYDIRVAMVTREYSFDKHATPAQFKRKNLAR